MSIYEVLENAILTLQEECEGSLTSLTEGAKAKSEIARRHGNHRAERFWKIISRYCGSR
ncbi:hypothetical protein [Marinobacterium sedimentorum]|uniref:hypothetical protein n=1 Tax=Marinobacterium sedimentorum TaxID=2927804 RepID=UPI0020C6612B|nr:hypothetical protein [Marinobacterium sedimentorum]MCP8685943.1 hypothetical protein [Marinobacterium sedimentorum]